MKDGLRIQRGALALGLVVVASITLYLLRPILTPFVAGALLAYLADPPTRRLVKMGLGRTLAVIIVFLLLTSVFGLALMLLIPMVGRQIDLLQSQLPAMLVWLQNDFLPWVEQITGVAIGEVDFDAVRSAIGEHWQTTGNLAADIIAQATRSGLALVGSIALLTLIPVVAFYLLRDWDRVLNAASAVLPPAWRMTFTHLARECDEVVGAFLRGQLLVMISLGIIYGVGLRLVGLELGVLIGFLSGLAAIVPYLGFLVGITAASIAAIFQYSDWLIPLLLVWGVFAIGQTLESVALTPWLVGDRIGLHPVAVIFAVLAGGQLFGFVGVLIALPVAAVIMVLMRHAHRFMTNEKQGPLS